MLLKLCEWNHVVQIATEATLDVGLSDICIATSAAPTFLPAHYFTKQDEQGNVVREFNLIDGGVAANNPVRLLRQNKRDK